MRSFGAMLLFVVACGFILLPDAAHAAMAGGGGNFPWDTGLQSLQREFTGPLPFVIGVLAFVAAVAGLAFAHQHLSGIVNLLLIVTIVVSILVNIPNMMTLLAGSGAVV